MNYRKLFKKRSLFWCSLILLASVFSLVYLILNGNTPQSYTDIIVEYTALTDSNKSMDISLFKILIAVGSLFVLLYELSMSRNKTEMGTRVSAGNRLEGWEFVLESVIIISTVYLFLYQKINYPIFISIIYFVILSSFDREAAVTGIFLYYTAYYCVFAIYRIYVFFGGETNTNDMLLTIAALVVACAPLLAADRKKAMIRANMLAQVLIPFLMLVFLQDKYLNAGEIVVIDNPMPAVVFAVALIIVLFVGTIVHLFKNWKSASDINDSIFVESCIAIMVFNFFTGTGAVMVNDIHHPFENIIGYSQIFELGQRPFIEYIPISGLYSVVQGAIFKLFGNGLFSNYAITNDIYFTFFIIVIVLLLKRQVNMCCLFAVVLFVSVTDYSRIVLVLPVMLALSDREWIRNKNRWLKIWFLTSLVHGLFYPLLGVAVAAAFLPLGILQIVTYLRSAKFRKDLKTMRFWLGWALCILPAVLCAPLLLGTVKHMLNVSGDSILADGITRFGQVIPDVFLPYLSNHIVLRTALRYLFTFLVPSLLVWLSVMVAVRAGGVAIAGHKVRVENIEEGCIGIAPGIMLSVAYLYTVIRLDLTSLFARSLNPMIMAAVIFLVCAVKNQEKLGRMRFLCGAFVLICAVANVSGFGNNGSKTAYCYSVPEDYVYVENDPVEKLGTGFIHPGLYKNICDRWELAKTLDKSKTYFGRFESFGYYYLFDIKGVAAIECGREIKSYEGASEAIEYIRNNKSLIGYNYSSYNGYYFYNWLVTSGEYYYSPENKGFLCADGVMTKEEALQINKDFVFGDKGGGTKWSVNALGKSMDSLEGLFTDPGISLGIAQSDKSAEIDFSRMIDGDEADFLYLEFDGVESDISHVTYNLDGDIIQKEDKLSNLFQKTRYNVGKNVVIGWTEETGDGYDFRCALGNGKLLIPLGAGVRWLRHDHDGLKITLEFNEEQIVVPQIRSARLLKLREVV